MANQAESAMEPTASGDRDEQGRILPGATGNPAGRPARQDYARLLQAAARVGAAVHVLVPTRAPRQRRDHDLPPAA
jgi:hypothetical protein